MIISFCFNCVFAVLINKVRLQVTEEAVIGGSVVLPCSSTEHDHKLQDINVHWRHNNRKIVYDIINGERSLVFQDPQYKNRTKTFPGEYLRGNFSLRLNNLTYTDAGKYNCLIAHSSEPKTVQLIISEKENKTSEENQGEDTGADSVVNSSSLLWVYIVVPALIFFIAFFIIICHREKNKATLFSPVTTEGKDRNDINL